MKHMQETKHGGSLFFVTLYAIFLIEFFTLHHWKEELKTVFLSG